MEPAKLDKYLNLELNRHRPLAFFGIKAHESHESIRNWVKWCKRQGFRGFNIIIASDCIGRANDEWINMLLDAYETAFKTAREEGLEVWIFDDWGYPSGTAGGLVCTEDSYRAKKLVISHNILLNKGEHITLTMPGKLVSAGILVNNAFERIKAKPGDTFEYACVDDHVRIVVVSWDYDEHASKSSCKSYPGDPAMSCIDMLNPGAARKFTNLMHDMYYQRFSEYFGDVIKGFFYDEPYLRFEFPYTEKLFDEFREKKGYDLAETLPYLLANIRDNQHAVKEETDDFFDVYTDMVADGFYGVLKKWCGEHGVELSGHMDLDHHLNTLNTISGHFFRNMKHNDRPAIDVIWAQIEPGVFTDFPRYAGSVKRISGRKHAVSETFAGMGQGLTGDLMRYITDHQVIRGIDEFHLMYSNNSPDTPAESPQMPNHMLQEPFGKLIYNRMAAASAISCYGMPAANTAVYVPCYDLYRAQLSIGQLTVNNAERFIWEWVNDIARELTYMPCDFDYIWDEAILSLELAEGGFLTGSGHIIDTIILPPNCTIKSGIADKLKSFRKSGGRIISVFRYNPLLEQEAILSSELSSLKSLISHPVSITPQSSISLCTRIGRDKTVYMLLNESPQDTETEICISDTGVLYEANLTDGSLTPVSAGGSFRFPARFDGCGLKVFIADKKGSVDALNTAPERKRENGIEPCDWRILLPDNTETAPDGRDLPDWASLGWPEYSGSMKYTSYFDYDSDKAEAILSMPGLHYHAIVHVDGKEAGRVAYRPYELVLSGLGRGKHKLEIEVYNTGANEVAGTIEAEKKRYSKRFAHMAAYDRKRLRSGLLGRVMIYPV